MDQAAILRRLRPGLIGIVTNVELDADPFGFAHRRATADKPRYFSDVTKPSRRKSSRAEGSS
jgi:hypothetical protein